jgi:hypothetical protein
MHGTSLMARALGFSREDAAEIARLALLISPTLAYAGATRIAELHFG